MQHNIEFCEYFFVAIESASKLNVHRRRGRPKRRWRDELDINEKDWPQIALNREECAIRCAKAVHDLFKSALSQSDRSVT
ncbi:hypothetical protein SFRURICE_000798 [Spodoptera frugiperda]|nr:hypothetical protein SFRURICE_000798 [Spodoptera frugiperda]